MEVNNDLKAEIIRRFGSQVVGANEMGIRENRLSYIVRGHTVPTEQEREALEAALGRAAVQKLLKGSPRSKSKKEVNADVRTNG